MRVLEYKSTLEIGGRRVEKAMYDAFILSVLGLQRQSRLPDDLSLEGVEIGIVLALGPNIAARWNDPLALMDCAVSLPAHNSGERVQWAAELARYAARTMQGTAKLRLAKLSFPTRPYSRPPGRFATVGEAPRLDVTQQEATTLREANNRQLLEDPYAYGKRFPLGEAAFAGDGLAMVLVAVSAFSGRSGVPPDADTRIAEAAAKYLQPLVTTTALIPRRLAA